MSGLEIYTLSHVIISLIAIVAGIPMVWAFTKNRTLPGWTLLFVVMTFLTNAGGFAFPFVKVLPSHVISALALIILAVTILADYKFQLKGKWKNVYIIGMVTNLFFLFFVLIAQGFGKVPFLHDLAPTQSEPPFAIAQLILLVIFVVIGFKANRAFKA